MQTECLTCDIADHVPCDEIQHSGACEAAPGGGEDKDYVHCGRREQNGMQAKCLSCNTALQVMCPVTESDIQEHVRLRLESERIKTTYTAEYKSRMECKLNV